MSITSKRPDGRMTLANQLTMLRIVMALAMVAALMAQTQAMHAAAFLLCTAAMITDWIDGYIARVTQTISAFGKVADPIADKILVLGALTGLVHARIGVPLWGLFLIVARELLIGGVRVLATAHGKIPAAQSWGKLSMGVQSGCVLAMIGLLVIGRFQYLSYYLTIVCVVAAWNSAYFYFRQSRKVLEKSWE